MQLVVTLRCLKDPQQRQEAHPPSPGDASGHLPDQLLPCVPQRQMTASGLVTRAPPAVRDLNLKTKGGCGELV